MPVIFKKMQMNINQTRNVAFVPNANANANSIPIARGQKSLAGLYAPMVNRIAGAKSGCGCGK